MGTSAEHGTGAQISVRGVRTRKRRSIQEKLQIVQETLSDVSVAVVARRYGINANQLFAWRRQYQRGELKAGPAARAAEAVILPVRVAQLPRGHTPSSAIETGRLTSGAPRVEIELADGPRVKIWDISCETLRALIRDLVRPC
jgi:transposase-like protein